MYNDKTESDKEELFDALIEDGYANDLDEAEEYHDENYQGVYGSDADFARQTAEDLGELESDRKMSIYIDWEHYARDVMMDYFTIEVGSDTHYYRSA